MFVRQPHLSTYNSLVALTKETHGDCFKVERAKQAPLMGQATYLIFVFVFRFSKGRMPSVLYTLKPTLSRQSGPRIVTVTTISCF